MRLPKLLLFAFFAFAAQCAVGQNRDIDKGDEAYQDLAFSRAAKFYERGLKKDFSKRALIRLADCYRLVNDYKKAEVWYAKVVNLNQIDSLNYFYYAQSLMNNRKYDAARTWFLKFNDVAPSDGRGLSFAEACLNINAFYKDTANYSLREVRINSDEADFGPAYFKEGIVFSSSRASGSLIANNYSWDNQPFLDLYYSEVSDSGRKYSKPKVLKGKLNTRFHEAVASFDRDEQQIFFTRNNFFEGKKTKDSTGVIHLKIFYADLTGNGWKNIRSLPFNSDVYSVGHPSLSADGSVLYFISDMPGGRGGTDLYLSKRKGDSWGPPVNLGPEVNTPGDEMFPFMHEDGTLYFASNGQAGLGGLDVFQASFNNGKWGEVENLGAPVNSAGDDFSLIIDSEKRTGFFSSNRVGGTGNDDLYYYEVLKPSLNGIVVSKITGQPIEGAKITLIDKATKKEVVLYSSPSGRYNYSLEPDKEYLVRVEKPDYELEEEEFSTVGIKGKDKVEQVIRLDQAPLLVEGLVLEDGTEEPIEYAKVRLLREDFSILTNKEGQFNLYLDPKKKRGYLPPLKDESFDCIPQRENNHCFRFFDQGAIETDTAKFDYRWDMGDGTILEGLEVEHCFPGAGQYEVKLQVIDPISRKVINTETTYDLVLSDIQQVYIASKDTVTVGNSISFDGSSSVLDGCDITSYAWDFGDETTGFGEQVSHVFLNEGIYRVKLKVAGVESDGSKACRTCVYKEIFVLAPGAARSEIPAVYLDPDQIYFIEVSKPGFNTQLIPYQFSGETDRDSLIVYLKRDKKKVLVEGYLFDGIDSTQLDEVEVILTNLTTGETEIISTGPDGFYSFELDPNQEYEIMGRKTGYLTNRVPINTIGLEPQTLRKNVPLDPVIIGKTFILHNIYYDFDQWFIRDDAGVELDKLVRFMRDNPTLRIELSSHTDARGSDAYNLSLSQKRAQSAVNYLIYTGGLGGGRVIATGYGEQKLRFVECGNGSDCPEELHQLNRRTEFTIIGFTDPYYSEALTVDEITGEYFSDGYTLDDIARAYGGTDGDGSTLDIFAPDPRKTPPASSFNPAATTFEPGPTDAAPDPGEVEGELYSVQLGVFRNRVHSSFTASLGEYKGALVRERVAGDLTRYRVGNVKSYETALKHLERIRKKGYSDAFIIALGSKSVSEAREEMLNGGRPDDQDDDTANPDGDDDGSDSDMDSDSGSAQDGSTIAGDDIGDGGVFENDGGNTGSELIGDGSTDDGSEEDGSEDGSGLPDLDAVGDDVDAEPQLVYRVQIGVFSKQVSNRFLTAMGEFRNLLEVVPYEGNRKYLVGKYTTYDDGKSALQRLVSRGYTDAFIVAYYKGDRIPIQEARGKEGE